MDTLNIYDESTFGIWNICSEISTKKDWYSKVFDKDIVEKWRDEVLKQNNKVTNDEFEYALSLMKASAVGTKHNSECEWEDGQKICKDCMKGLKLAIAKKHQEKNNKKDKKNEEENENEEENDEEENDWLLDFDEDDEDAIVQWLWEQDDDEVEALCNHPFCTCIPANSELHQYISYKNDVTGKDLDLHEECKKQIHAIMEEEPIDWHPGSGNQVRNLIHPSMYCYVAGKSVNMDGQVIDTQERTDDSTQYQWLPSKFSVLANGKTKVSSYINNFNSEKYPEFVSIIERMFSMFIPDLEKVMGKNVRGRDVQVIVKVGNVILDKNNPEYKGGSWHIEGMPQEHIAATCIHYVDADNITDSFLEFRKPVIVSEDLDYPQNDARYTTHHYGITPDSHFEGKQNRYLGLIKCTEGASVVFPNTLQHRVKEFRMVDKDKPSLRTIVAFFVIDPDRPIIDTSQVPPQQGVFSVHEALHYRKRLMYHRKYFVNQINKEVYQREYSLCEH
jgi:hypothetical protein